MEGFRKKSPQHLEKQVQEVSQILSTEVAPPTGDILSEDEMRGKYRARYDAYVHTLRESRKEEKDEEVLLRAREMVTGLNNLDHFIETQKKEDLDARGERQFSVYEDLQEFLESGGTAGYVKLPTGVGKTVIFAHLIEALGLESYVVVPTKKLVEQTQERFNQFTEIESGKFYQNEKDADSRVLITTYSSFVAQTKKKNFAQRPLLILDEVHYALGEEAMKVLQDFGGIQIGFTATDEFSEEKTVQNLLPEKIHTMHLREAIQEGCLATTETIHAHTEIDLSSVPVTSGTLNQAELEKALNVAARNEAAVSLYTQAFEGRKAIVNCSGIAHAEAVSKLFTEKGVPSEVVTSRTQNRDDIVEKFRTGEILVLCNVKVLIPGFDEPSCSLALNLHPSFSRTDVEQRGGRPLRLDEHNPNKVGTVVDFIDKDAKKKPILFSEILGGAYVSRGRKGNRDADVPEGGGGAGYAYLDIKGLKVSVDPVEVMRVSKEFSDSREREEFDFGKLKTEVQAVSITSSRGYVDISSEKGWPATKTLRKNPEWKGWDDFLGREIKKNLLFEELRTEVLAAGIKSSYGYQNISSEKGWPSFGFLIKNPEWKSLDDFFGREKLDFEKLKAEVRAVDVKSSKEYAGLCSEKGWPVTSTLLKKPEWKGWDDFLGREIKKNLLFEELRTEVRTAGIMSSGGYADLSSERGWPVTSTLRKKPEWRGWDDFLGRENFDFGELKAEVLAAGIQSSYVYQSISSENGWPTPSTLLKKPEWKGWDDFLGRETFDFGKLQAVVRAAGVQSSNRYVDISSEKGWPVASALRKKPEWKGWDDFLGRKK